MIGAETLGVLAHRGGLLVRRPELTVGMVQAVARPGGLTVELLARQPLDRQPLDRRSAVERQADIRAGRGGTTPAPRRLLAAYDEGSELRVGWLDAGRARWVFGSTMSSSGDHHSAAEGPSLRAVLQFPPLFDRMSLVLAWPEIGFAETVVDLPLPDRATVERDTVSVWRAPVDSRPPPDPLRHHTAALTDESCAIETGRVVAEPRVVHRGEDAVVVLTRLSSVGGLLSMELSGLARGSAGAAAAEAAQLVPPARTPTGGGARGGGHRPTAAIVRDGEAHWLTPYQASAMSGPAALQTSQEYVLSRPDKGILDLLVAWPVAGLAEAQVSLAVEGR